LKFLKNNPLVELEEFGRMEAKQWDAHHSEQGMDLTHKSHGVYNMNHYSAFISAFGNFSQDLLNDLAQNSIEIMRARSESIHYGIRGPAEAKEPQKWIDIVYFAYKLSNANVSDKLKASSGLLIGQFNKMLVSKASGTERKHEALGLSITYPHNYESWDSWYGPKYEKLAFTAGPGRKWYEFLNNVKDLSNQDGKAPTLLASGDLAGFSNPGRSMDAKIPNNFKMADFYAEMEVEIKDGQDVFEIAAAVVTNEATDNSYQYIYLGEVDLIRPKGNGKYQVSWDAALPVISLADDSGKSRPLSPGTIIQRKGLAGKLPVYLGGWYLDETKTTMVSYAEYETPKTKNKTSLILYTKFDHLGGRIVTVLEDSGEDLSGLETAPVESGFNFEAGGKLWPVFYMEEPSQIEIGKWESWYVWFDDGYITIPEGGLDGLVVTHKDVEPGDYKVEVQTSDLSGNLSETLNFNFSVPQNAEVPTISIQSAVVNGGSGFMVRWQRDFSEFKLQYKVNLDDVWRDAAGVTIDSDQNTYQYRAKASHSSQFYRLIYE
jgi:hypothetical protein